MFTVIEPIYRVKTTTNNKTTLHFESKNEKEARAFFKRLFPSMYSLKDYREIQHDSKRYTEVLLVKGFEYTSWEFPVWHGFVETNVLMVKPQKKEELL